MNYEQLNRVSVALGEQEYRAFVDWHLQGCPANRRKALRKLGRLAENAWKAAYAAAPHGYEGPIDIRRSVSEG